MLHLIVNLLKFNPHSGLSPHTQTRNITRYEVIHTVVFNVCNSVVNVTRGCCYFVILLFSTFIVKTMYFTGMVFVYFLSRKII